MARQGDVEIDDSVWDCLSLGWPAAVKCYIKPRNQAESNELISFARIVETKQNIPPGLSPWHYFIPCCEMETIERGDSSETEEFRNSIIVVYLTEK